MLAQLPPPGFSPAPIKTSNLVASPKGAETFAVATNMVKSATVWSVVPPPTYAMKLEIQTYNTYGVDLGEDGVWRVESSTNLVHWVVVDPAWDTRVHGRFFVLVSDQENCYFRAVKLDTREHAEEQPGRVRVRSQ